MTNANPTKNGDELRRPIPLKGVPRMALHISQKIFAILNIKIQLIITPDIRILSSNKFF